MTIRRDGCRAARSGTSARPAGPEVTTSNARPAAAMRSRPAATSSRSTQRVSAMSWMSARTPTTLPRGEPFGQGLVEPGTGERKPGHHARDLGMRGGFGQHAIGVARRVGGLHEHDVVDAQRGALCREAVEPEVVVERGEVGGDPAVVAGGALPDVGVRIDDAAHAVASRQYPPSGNRYSSIEGARISAL